MSPLTRIRQAIKCKAHAQKTGKACGRYAMEGQLVCERHGGKAPQNMAAAQLRLAEVKARNSLVRLSVKPVGNALEELARVAGECVAWKDKMGELVNKLTEDAIRYEGRLNGEQIRAELILWERALDRCLAALTSMARLNLDERLARIEERKADMLADALSAALSDAGLSVEVAGEIRRGFARRIVAIAS